MKTSEELQAGIQSVAKRRLNGASNKVLMDLLDRIPGGVGIYEYFNDGHLEQLFLNDGYYQMLGESRRSRSQFNGEGVMAAVHPDDRSCALESIDFSVKTISTIDLDMRILLNDGGVKWVNVRATVARKMQDRTVMYAIYSDIDDVKKMEMELAEGKRAIETLVEHGNVLLWRYDLDEHLASQNFHMMPVMGYPRHLEEVPEGLVGSGIIYPEDEDVFLKMYADILDGKQKSECTARVFDYAQSKYIRRHWTLTRQDDVPGAHRTAVGFGILAEESGPKGK